ncbi:MAG: dihydroorotase, partial [Bacteroidia bacterium]|nr:dihydroorotase [Bacteroidia bacterium]
MNILIKQAKIISDNSAYESKPFDILIEGGIITDIKRSISAKPGVKVIEAKDLCVSAGWLDMQTVSCDPGFEHKEDLDSLIKCAAAGGFTTVCVHNYNQPALHNKSQIEYLINKSKNKVVDVLPMGTITVEGKGKELAEMFDMKSSGAVAFSDYKHTIKEAGMLARALQYSENIGSFVVTHCSDESLAGGWQMNEGETSTMLGL